MADEKTPASGPQIVKDFTYVPRLSVVQTFRKGADTKTMTKSAIEHGVSVGAITGVPAATAKE